MDIKLKPCPFCGRAAVQKYSVNTDTYVYGCYTNGCMGNAQNNLMCFGTVKEAIEAWNRRADDGKIELIDRAAVRALAYVSSDWSHGAHPLVVELSDIDDLPTINAEWELFQRITDAYYDKQMFFLQDDGSVYDRYEAVYHASIDAAIDAFILRISEG